MFVILNAVKDLRDQLQDMIITSNTLLKHGIHGSFGFLHCVKDDSKK
jgi:hypothetical protein